MLRIGAVAAITAGALAASAAGTQAHAQARGGYEGLSGTCQNVQTLQTGYVTAECRDPQGRYRWSSIYAPYCRSDLTNQNGVLSCAGATASAGGYVQAQQASSPAASIIGAIAGALLGTNDQPQYANDQPLYAPDSRYPVWGEPGYGDPRTDPRFGQQGWGYGSTGEWVPIARRQQWLERRIEQGESQGALTRAESASLRRELNQLDRLEGRYAAGGLSNAERADLDRRFDTLGVRIRSERRDDQDRWANINERQREIDARIDAGMRDNSLNRAEATRLRAEFREIAALEANYRRGGLSNSERADLDRRFDALSARVRGERQYSQDRWANVNERQRELDARIDAGLRDRSLTQQEAARLRMEFHAIARVEAGYRRGGLSNTERADLDRRFDALSAQIRGERLDSQDRWANVNERQRELDARIDAGLRDRSLTQLEAARLRTEFQEIARAEAYYRQGGLTNPERADLDRRFDALSAQIREQRQDWQGATPDFGRR